MESAPQLQKPTCTHTLIFNYVDIPVKLIEPETRVFFHGKVFISKMNVYAYGNR